MKQSFPIIFAFLALSAAAQTRTFTSLSKNGYQLDIAVSDGRYHIVFYNRDIVETSFIPAGETFNPESHAVVLAPGNFMPSIKENASSIKATTPGIMVKIDKSPFRISYWYKEKELLSEKNGYAKRDSTETLDFNIDANEALYGGGARVLGFNRRGNRLELYNRAHYGYETRAELMNFCIPLVLSSKLYAVHFDNPAIGFLDLDSKHDNTLAYETKSGRKTYQVIGGDSWENLIGNYTSLTGRQPMPPIWALGNFASRFGYRDQEMAETTARHFNEDGIPVDAMIFDLYWFGKTIKGTMGNLEFDRETFPEPEKMMGQLKAKGIHTVLITEPFILTTSKKWNEAATKKVLATNDNGAPFIYDFYFGHTGIIDIFKPEARDWFWSIYKNLHRMGATGIWGDLGEPEVFPSKAITSKGKADEVHNIYGHEWAKMIADGYKKDFPDERPFILMRAGYSGSQRFGMIPWSGDVNRSWGGLSGQPEIALEMGMQGMAYMHSDLGGFAGEYNDSELYLRWLQYGVFQPVFRPHAQELVASEPVYKDLETKAAAKKIIELRYKLLPYNYDLSFENHLSGVPMMRPLLFTDPENPQFRNLTSTYLWGNDFLVTPILQKGAAKVSVWFPRGRWFDFFDAMEGRNSQTVFAAGARDIQTRPDHIPVFVRGGSFVPMMRNISNTGNYDPNSIELHYFMDAQSPQTVESHYIDDGKTPDAYEKGQSEMLRFTANLKSSSLTISISDVPGRNFKPAKKRYFLYIHGLAATASHMPKNVTVGKEKMSPVARDAQTFYVPVDVSPGTTEVNIQF
jgi:alpha-glucosidase (family GH31 glycosyl hydrolase)